MTFRRDYDWQMQFIPGVKRILARPLLQVAPYEKDAKEATDLLVLHADGVTIGCRLRRLKNGYADRYPWEFTIRAKRDSGAATELEKIEKGFGDWLVYGHAGHTPAHRRIIPRWFVIDLDVWRYYWANNRAVLHWGRKPNGDGTYFAWFDIRSFPPDPAILIDASHDVPKQTPSRAQVPLLQPALTGLPLFD